MIHARYRQLLIVLTFLLSVAAVQAFTFPPDEDKPKNLKVLPKNISHEELIAVMRGFSKSLGVHCDFCHKKLEEGSAGNPPKMDFASDEKPEKTTARGMMKMTASINKKYLHKMGGGHFEQITCVTCHMGHTTPIVSVDSLKKR